jgi:hypothetical protein
VNATDVLGVAQIAGRAQIATQAAADLAHTWQVLFTGAPSVQVFLHGVNAGLTHVVPLGSDPRDRGKHPENAGELFSLWVLLLHWRGVILDSRSD